jgi:hypothetical protein
MVETFRIVNDAVSDVVPKQNGIVRSQEGIILTGVFRNPSNIAKLNEIKERRVWETKIAVFVKGTPTLLYPPKLGNGCAAVPLKAVSIDQIINGDGAVKLCAGMFSGKAAITFDAVSKDPEIIKVIGSFMESGGEKLHPLHFFTNKDEMPALVAIKLEQMIRSKDNLSGAVTAE